MNNKFKLILASSFLIVQGHAQSYTDEDKELIAQSDMITQSTSQKLGSCNFGEQAVYSLYFAHPSSNISSYDNKVLLQLSCKRYGVIHGKNSVVLGTLTGNPSLYKMNYDYSNKPYNGYDRLSHYQYTSFNGLSQRYFYASFSKAEFINKLSYDIRYHLSQRYPDNVYGGNLNRDDNFWVKFIPNSYLIQKVVQYLY